MSISCRLVDLYDRWEREHLGERLIRQGLVDEEMYLASNPRIVLLGKEVNQRKNPNFELLEFLRNELQKGKGGNRFARPAMQAGLWTYGILNQFPKYQELDLEFHAAQGVQRIGWTNLSKNGGTGKADITKVKEVACAQLNLWKQELTIMDPQLILCSGSYGLMVSLLGLERRQLIPKGSKHRRFDYSIWRLKGYECLCLDFYHHSARRGYDKYYNLLKDVLEECKKLHLCTWE